MHTFCRSLRTCHGNHGDLQKETEDITRAFWSSVIRNQSWKDERKAINSQTQLHSLFLMREGVVRVCAHTHTWYMRVYGMLNIFPLFLHLFFFFVFCFLFWVKWSSHWTQSSPFCPDWLATQQSLGSTFSNPSLSAGVTGAPPSQAYVGARDQNRGLHACGRHFTCRATSPALFVSLSVCLRQGLDVLAGLNSHLDKAGLTHTLILLSLPPKCWDYRYVPPCSGTNKIFEVNTNNPY